MRYLFFDIECANCFGSAKICSFGYVLTNKDFTILAKEDIIINPRSKFYKPPNKHVPGAVIEPAYPAALYRRAPEFPDVYDTIRALLQNPDHIVIGHAPQNDAHFLMQSAARYRLPDFDFRFFDAQALYMAFAEPGAKMALESVCEALDIPVLHTHCSMDDSYMTMQYAKLLAAREKKPLETLFSRYPTTRWEVLDGHLVHYDASGNPFIEARENERIALFRAAAKLAATRETAMKNPLRFLGSNRANPTRQKDLSACLAEIEETRAATGIFAGKRISIGTAYTKENLVQTAYLAARIAAEGGIYEQSGTSRVDMYVYPPQDIPFTPCFRYQSAKARQKKGHPVQFVSFSSFLEKLHIPAAWLATVAPPAALAAKLKRSGK